MFCRKCGQEIPNDSEFCPWCGEKMKILTNYHDTGKNGDSVTKAVFAPKLQQKSGNFLTRPIKKKTIVRFLVMYIIIIVVFGVASVVGKIIKERNSSQTPMATTSNSDSKQQVPAINSTWSIINATDSFGDAVQGQFAMKASFDGTAATITNQTVDVFVAVEIAEHPQNNSNVLKDMSKGFMMSFTPIVKATGQPLVYTETEATIEIKADGVKYMLFGDVSGNNIVLNALYDLKDYIPSDVAVGNIMINTQELLHIIYTSGDVEFVLNGTCRFTLHKGNFNKVFDGADWQDPSEISGKKKK